MLRTLFPRFSRRRVINPKQAYHFKILIKVRAVNVVMSRNSEDFNIFIFIDINFLCKRCSLLFNCHSVPIGLEETSDYETGVTKEHNYINWSQVLGKSKIFYLDIVIPGWPNFLRLVSFSSTSMRCAHSVLQNTGLTCWSCSEFKMFSIWCIFKALRRRSFYDRKRHESTLCVENLKSKASRKDKLKHTFPIAPGSRPKNAKVTIANATICKRNVNKS